MVSESTEAIVTIGVILILFFGGYIARVITEKWIKQK